MFRKKAKPTTWEEDNKVIIARNSTGFVILGTLGLMAIPLIFFAGRSLMGMEYLVLGLDLIFSVAFINNGMRQVIKNPYAIANRIRKLEEALK